MASTRQELAEWVMTEAVNNHDEAIGHLPARRYSLPGLQRATGPFKSSTDFQRGLNFISATR
jgi:hypothetical protein